MKIKLILAILLVSLLACAGAFAEEDYTLYEKQPDGSVKAEPLGEPTQEEISHMQREYKDKEMEDFGFDDAYDDTMPEMAGDDSAGAWMEGTISD